jgi:4,5-DOPA dioxygenase extradiol
MMYNRGEDMPVFFFGHGSPMNALEENDFTRGWRDSVSGLALPSAVLCISAHWETKGTHVTGMAWPKTIHDFGGFPRDLYAVQYPAPGSPELAALTRETVKNTDIGIDNSWGLDHGCWSVLRHLFPKAEVPVFQLSLDYYKTPAEHLSVAKELAGLREKGVLIIGSGNMVHNLRAVDWDNPEGGFDWAAGANGIIKDLIKGNDTSHLANYMSLGKEVAMAVPTPEHYLPLLYALALRKDHEEVTFFNDRLVMGSLSMTSFRVS